jgi:hypothetical protein
MATYSERMQQIAAKYVAAGGRMPATSHEIAEWAISQGLWRPRPSAIITSAPRN